MTDFMPPARRRPRSVSVKFCPRLNSVTPRLFSSPVMRSLMTDLARPNLRAAAEIPPASTAARKERMATRSSSDKRGMAGMADEYRSVWPNARFVKRRLGVDASARHDVVQEDRNGNRTIYFWRPRAPPDDEAAAVSNAAN